MAAQFQTGTVIIELLLYLGYVAYLIYRSERSIRMTRKLAREVVIIQNPPGPVAAHWPQFVVILCLPSVFVLLALPGEAGVTGSLIYFGILVFFIATGLAALLPQKGDYYLGPDGIHFIRHPEKVLAYSSIEEATWHGRFTESADQAVTSVTKLRAKGKRIKLYNLSSEQYRRYISSEDIHPLRYTGFAPSPAQRILKRTSVVLSVCAGVAFAAFIIYSGFYGGGGVSGGPEPLDIAYLLSNKDVQHYLYNHGDEAAVPYNVWLITLILEKTSMTLIPLSILLGGVNALWTASARNKTVD